MRKFIVTCSLLGALLVSVLVEFFCSAWQKNYFTMAITAVFFLYWGIEFVLDYIESKKDYPAKFEYFSAEYVNKHNIPLEEIEKNRKYYYKKFKKSITKDILIHYTKFLVCFSLTVAIVIAMCL